MSFLRKLSNLFSHSPNNDSKAALWIYARCNRCNEVLSTRVDLLNDLSMDDQGGYVCRKVIIGSNRCFERIEVMLNFDRNRHLNNQEILNGQFITAEEYAAETGDS